MVMRLMQGPCDPVSDSQLVLELSWVGALKADVPTVPGYLSRHYAPWRLHGGRCALLPPQVLGMGLAPGMQAEQVLGLLPSFWSASLSHLGSGLEGRGLLAA